MKEIFKKPDTTTNRDNVLPPPSAVKESKRSILDKALSICASSANPEEYEEIERIFKKVIDRIKSE